MEENICAISTALGVGAISIIRCSGPDVIKIVSSIFKGHDLNNVDTHTIHYGHITNDNEIIDEVLISIMKAPKTFTTEDTVEINCHGGISVTNRILELLIEKGMRLATRGEFTKRAYLNGRIDLLEAEGINDLINSESEEQRKYAISRTIGNLSKLIIENRQVLVELQAKLEVNFDYPEETDNIEMTHQIVIKELSKISEKLNDLLKNSKDTQIIKNGINIAILGQPNVGKSSILNHLLDEKKAIVTDIAGTTRDIVEGSITLSGIKINLIDTAGIRNTRDIVEKIGVEKSLEAASKADLVIYVLSNNVALTPTDLEQLKNIQNVEKIVFINKNDLNTKIDIDEIKDNLIVYGNTLEKNGLDALKKAIISLFNIDSIKNSNYNCLANANQVALVKTALNAVESGIKSAEEAMPLEMIAEDIKEAYDALGEIIGATYKDELLDELFSNFCLGK